MPSPSSPGAFFYSQMIYHPPLPTKKLTGQTVIVTGSNVGLGLEAARHFVRLDANKVILAVRNLEKGQKAKLSIVSSEKTKADVVEVWKLDLGDYRSVKEFTARAQGLERLDIVVENAGILTEKWSMMEENESTITTNVVSQFLHAIPLLPKLRETAVKFNTLPHLVFTTSFIHWHTKFPERKEDKIFAALADPKKARMGNRYNVSKLIEIYCVQELAELQSASQKEGRVVINHVNPGWVVSEVFSEVMREWSGLKQIIFPIVRSLVARPTEIGARTLVNAAEGGEETHGQYMDDCVVGKRAPLVTSEEGKAIQKKLWLELSQKLESIQSGILQNI